MKKINNKEFEEKLSQDLEKYYNNIEVPELSNEKKAEFHKLIEQNKPKKRKFMLWQKITAVASTVCMLILIIVPTIIILNKNDTPDNPPAPPIYYGKAEATKIIHTIEETQTLINTNFPKYNFIFNDLTFISAKGFYHPENDSLLAIQINFSEKEIPLPVEIYIIASEFFTFDDKNTYTKNAEHTTTENYEMYKITKQDDFNEYQLAYIIFDNHEIYIKLGRINEILFNKFI